MFGTILGRYQDNDESDELISDEAIEENSRGSQINNFKSHAQTFLNHDGVIDN